MITSVYQVAASPSRRKDYKRFAEIVKELKLDGETFIVEVHIYQSIDFDLENGYKKHPPNDVHILLVIPTMKLITNENQDQYGMINPELASQASDHLEVDKNKNTGKNDDQPVEEPTKVDQNSGHNDGAPVGKPITVDINKRDLLFSKNQKILIIASIILLAVLGLIPIKNWLVKMKQKQAEDQLEDLPEESN